VIMGRTGEVAQLKRESQDSDLGVRKSSMKGFRVLFRPFSFFHLTELSISAKLSDSE
jgi:hypothetical protein